jgi:hypothetical protein
MWRFYGQQYPIQDGQFYSWRVSETGESMGTYILWNNQWQLLASYAVDCTPNRCVPESYIEIYSAVTGEHPSWSGTLTAKTMDVRQSGGWLAWSSSIGSFVGDVNPYIRCPVSDYTEFNVRSSGSC